MMTMTAKKCMQNESSNIYHLEVCYNVRSVLMHQVSKIFKFLSVVT